MSNANIWVCTDDDTSQYVKDLGNGVFHVVQMGGSVEVGFSVREQIVDVRDRIKKNYEDVEQVINAYYGPIGLFALQEEYGDQTGQIVAEMISETEFLEQKPLFNGNPSACQRYIGRLIKQTR